MLKREEIWIITREYAGIAEAGGVKNVAQSLSEGLARLGKKVTVFIPKYGCVTDFALELFSAEIRSAGKTYPVTFSKTHSGTVDILFVESPVFAEKHAVYTYTERDEKTIPGAVRGQGHADADNMNAVFQLAVLVYAEKTGSAPAVVHCQDGHTAIIPALAREGSAYFGDVRALFRHTGFVTTVHNAGAGYRQVIYDPEYARALTGLPEGVLDKSVFHGRVEPFLLAAEYGLLSTVSPWYAEELVSPACDKDTDGLSGEFARRGIQITGITNGIDFHRYDPSNPAKSYLPFPYMPWFKDLRGKYRFREMLLKNQDLLDTDPFSAAGWDDVYCSIPPCGDLGMADIFHDLRVFFRIAAHHDLINFLIGQLRKIITDRDFLSGDGIVVDQILIFSIGRHPFGCRDRYRAVDGGRIVDDEMHILIRNRITIDHFVFCITE